MSGGYYNHAAAVIRAAAVRDERAAVHRETRIDRLMSAYHGGGACVDVIAFTSARRAALHRRYYI